MHHFFVHTRRLCSYAILLLLAVAYGSAKAQSIGINMSTALTGLNDESKIYYSRANLLAQPIYGLGVSYIHPVGRRLFFKTGISALYSQFTWKNVDDTRLFIDDDYQSSDIRTVGKANKIEQKYFLTVPLIAHYYLLRPSFSTNLYLAVGGRLRWQYHQSFRRDATYDGLYEHNLNGRDVPNYLAGAFTAGFGIKQAITSKVTLYLSPSVEYYSFKNATSDLHNAHFEGNIDLHYRLR